MTLSHDNIRCRRASGIFSCMIRRLIGLGLLATLVSGISHAQGLFLPVEDAHLRDDLTLLVDEGVINLPVNEWPLIRQDVAEAIRRIDGSDMQDVALRSALERVRRATTPRPDAGEWKLRELEISGGQPGLLRDVTTLARDNGEVTLGGGASNGRFSATLKATAVADPADGQALRFDGSDVSVRWGNWIFSANQMNRWWGPGRDGSLILSNNARPMPAVSLDRVRSLPVDLPVLRWLGPWRFSGFLGLMENERADVDHPLFMGMRLSFKPAPIFEFGMSRSAQFCGQGRRCNLGTLGRVLIGQDNVGRRGLDDPLDEPGNQMAGFDVRIVSPFNALPLAIYAQEIGEDNSSSGIPERYMAILGAEMWFMLDTGSVLRSHIEYANTKVKWYDSEIEWDWGYWQAIFTDGYTYRNRNIGHTTDGDSETTSFGLALITGEGHRWAALMRRGRLDSCCVPGFNSRITDGPSDYFSGQLSWEGKVAGQQLGLQLGYEDQKPDSAGRGNGVFGFIQWRKQIGSR